MAWLALILCAGCGDSSSGQDLSVPEDMTAVPDQSVVDLRVASDMAMAPICAPTIDRGDAGASMQFMCGASACAVNEYCCAVGTTPGSCKQCCAGGELPVQCSQPVHCGGKPCCVTFMGTTPRDITCQQNQTDFVPDFFGGRTRACVTNADCTAGAPSTSFNLCCDAPQGAKICGNAMLEQLSGGMVNCP
jgi:hypothetical protein